MKTNIDEPCAGNLQARFFRGSCSNKTQTRGVKLQLLPNIGISQIQFPSKDSSKLKFVSYFGAFVSLSIITNPVNVLFSLGTMFFRSEIKTLYIYKEIKTAKQQKMSKREYWEIFFKNNTIKVAAFLLFSAFITYLTFTTTFLLISLLGTIPLTMLLILLQSELRCNSSDLI